MVRVMCTCPHQDANEPFHDRACPAYKVAVSAVTVFVHDKHPCRLCGHKYERKGDDGGCWHGMGKQDPTLKCPKCGAPANEPNV